jgi:long-chain acyl-CoA synthetase
MTRREGGESGRMSSAGYDKVTLPHLIRDALAEPREQAFLERSNGVWTPTSSTQLLERVERVACALRDGGIGAGDRVALIAHDCIDWVVADFGTVFAGCVVVPIYPTQADDQTVYMLKHSDAKLIFVDSVAGAQRLRKLDVEALLVVLESTGDDGLAAFEARGAAVRNAHPDLLAAYEAAQRPDDLAVLIYTSGTTGNPKGVMLSHDNLGFDARSTLDCAREVLVPGTDALSVLPFSHIFEHTMLYIYLLGKARYSICHDPNTLLEDLRDVRPMMMSAVPRIFDRVLAGVTGKAMQHGGLQAKLVPWALRVGQRYARAIALGNGASPWLSAQYALAKKLVLDKIRAALGLDRIKGITSGSAALHDDVAMTFLGLGVPITQGYGLTETSPVLTVNRLSSNRYGTVGPGIAGTELKIAADGEVLARGRQVMQGYYKDSEATAAAIVDGWFHTGDIGELDGQGYLRITDRKKEVFKTSTGKFVSPARVESAIKRSVFISQAMVVGDGRPFPIAVICPNWDLVRVELKIEPTVTVEQLSQRETVTTFIRAEVIRQTADLASYEQIRYVVILPLEFSVESGELSPSMKVKRRVVETRYFAVIDATYAKAP